MKLTTLKPRLVTPPDRINTINPGSWRNDKQTSTQRGYGYKWQNARATYLAKHPFCAYCLRDAGISYEQDAEAIGLACMNKGVGLLHAQVAAFQAAHPGVSRASSLRGKPLARGRRDDPRLGNPYFSAVLEAALKAGQPTPTIGVCSV